MRTVLRSTAVAAVAMVLLAGCFAPGLYETARTAPPGEFQMGGALTPVNVAFTDSGVGVLLIPFPELSAKIGIAPGFDLGAKWAFGPGLGLNGKVQFLKGAMDGAFYCSGSFYGMFFGDAGFGMYSLSPRLILSSETRGKFPFAINAGVGYSGIIAGAGGETASGSSLAAAAGFGLPFRFGKNRSARVIPELSLSVPIFSSYEAGGETGIGMDVDALMLSAGIGFGAVGSE